MRKIICLILAVLMLVMLLVSCKDNGKDNETTGGDSNVVEEEVGLFDATEMKARHLAEGKVMNILCWNANHSEFEVTEDQITVNELNASVFERDNQVKNALGISKIIYNARQDGSSYAEEYVRYVESVVTNGDADVDIIATYSRTAGLCSQKGFFNPINYYDKYINLKNSWYPQQLFEEIAVKNNIYYVTGDISPNLLYYMYGFIFNKELMEKLGIDYNAYYEMSKAGEWTLEEMYKLCEYYEDTDSDGKKSVGDGYGFRSYYYNVDAFYNGSNLQLVDVNNGAEKVEDLIVISPDYGSSKAIDICDELGAFFTSDYAYVKEENMPKTFAQTRNTIGMLARIRFIGIDIQTLDEKLPVGILPVPKYDNNQQDYRCITGNPFSLWGVFSGNLDLEKEESAAGFIEYMGYFGKEHTTEAVFEDTFLGRYADQPDDAETFNTIRRTTAFDIGRIFAAVISPNGYMSEQWSKCACNGAKWNTIYIANVRNYSLRAKTASEDFWKLAEVLKNPYEFPYGE